MIKDCEQKTKIKNENTYWVYVELLWRDFFRFISLKHGDKIFHSNGPLIFGKSLYKKFARKGWKWSRDKALFDLWCNGQTGYPFIDAAMIELQLTGFMSNRMRMNVASCLVKDLGIYWVWGAQYFESLLIDFDAAQNYCNWNYIVGIGFDARPKDKWYNIDNIDKQASKYDKNGNFVKLWIPRLRGIPNQFIHAPYSMNSQQQEINRCVVGRDYYAPCKALSHLNLRIVVFRL